MEIVKFPFVVQDISEKLAVTWADHFVEGHSMADTPDGSFLRARVCHQGAVYNIYVGPPGVTITVGESE